jgi:hypothetical protein
LTLPPENVPLAGCFNASDERAQADQLAQQRRLTIRQLFERWASTDLASHVGVDWKRIGHKDGGQYVRKQFGRRVLSGLGDVAVAIHGKRRETFSATSTWRGWPADTKKHP